MDSDLVIDYVVDREFRLQVKVEPIGRDYHWSTVYIHEDIENVWKEWDEKWSDRDVRVLKVRTTVCGSKKRRDNTYV